MKSGICKKCSTAGIMWHIPHYTLHHIKCYLICEKCWAEWYDNGYYNVWLTLHGNDSHELADKLVLDFLGKLG